MRADRLLRLALLLQARGRMTAEALANELEVSVRTIYRDISALNAAGVPVWAESGPGGGCQLLDGYRTPLASLSTEEATALLTLATSVPLHELGLAAALESARERVRDVSGLASFDAVVHLDLPRWFGGHEVVPHLPVLAEAVRDRRLVDLTLESNGRQRRHRALAPLGLVNKAGTWYVVVSGRERQFAMRVARITALRLLDEAFDRPKDFDLPACWAQWASNFEASRPRITVVVRASPQALTDWSRCSVPRSVAPWPRQRPSPMAGGKNCDSPSSTKQQPSPDSPVSATPSKSSPRRP